MQHNLVRVLRAICRVTFAPVIRNSVCKDGSITVEGGARNSSADGWVALKTMLGGRVPNELLADNPNDEDSKTYQKWKVPSEPAVERV